MPDTTKPFERAMTLAAISGLKIALGPALLGAARNRPEASTWAMAALGEMVLDKVGVFPSRRRLPLLIPHALAGAYVAHESLKEDGVEEPYGAVLGAVVAAGVSSVVPVVRVLASRVLGIPDALLGVAEDYLALKIGTQAVGISMEQVGDAARNAVSEVRELAKPTLQSIGVQV